LIFNILSQYLTLPNPRFHILYLVFYTMKHLFVFIIIISVVGCKEIPPAIDFSSKKEVGDTTYVQTTVPQAQAKNVYLEEFTGAYCTNCPNGHIAIADFETQYGERVVPVSVHSGELSRPYPGNEDFQTPEGDNIQTNIYNEIGAQPSLGVDRRQFAGQPKREVLFLNRWTGFLSYQLRQETPCNLTLSSRFDAASNKIKVKTIVEYTKDVATTKKISVMLTESGKKAAQALPTGGVDANYVHKHVLRRMFTSWDGLLLPEVGVRGRVFVRNFEMTPAANWNLDSCSIVAFVHEATGDSIRVQQVKSVKLR
jgi:Outer membrane protein Omp28